MPRNAIGCVATFLADLGVNVADMACVARAVSAAVIPLCWAKALARFRMAAITTT